MPLVLALHAIAGTTQLLVFKKMLCSPRTHGRLAPKGINRAKPIKGYGLVLLYPGTVSLGEILRERESPESETG